MRRENFFCVAFIFGAIKMTINIFVIDLNLLRFVLLKFKWKLTSHKGVIWIYDDEKCWCCCRSALYIQYWVSLFSSLYKKKFFFSSLWVWIIKLQINSMENICGWIAQGKIFFRFLFYCVCIEKPANFPDLFIDASKEICRNGKLFPF